VKNYLLLSFFALLLVAVWVPIHDGDVFFCLSLGTMIFSGQWIPAEDPFLYTVKSWNIYHQWLAFPIFYFFYFIGGLTGLFIFRAALWCALFGVILYYAKKWKVQNSTFMAIGGLAAIVCSHRFIDRAAAMSDLLLIWLTAVFLDREKLSRRYLIGIPFLFAIWCNLHAAFVIGLALYSGYVVTNLSREWRAPVLSLIASYAATLINPRFLEGAIYPLHTAFKASWQDYRKINFEWMPTFQPPFIDAFEVKILILLLVLTTVLTALTAKRARLFTFFALAIYIYLAQNAARFISTSALGFLLLSIYAIHIKGIRLTESLERWISRGLAVIFTLATLVILQFGYPSSAGHQYPGTGIDPTSFPLEALEYIQKNKLEGRFFNQYEWGSFLIWSLDRRDNLFIHTHVDDPEFLTGAYYGTGRSYEQFKTTVERYNIQYFLLDGPTARRNPPIELIKFLGDWKILYQDRTSVLWGRGPKG
jgi:hypothetical protein